VQIAKAVEDILYAATQEEGEASLAAAIAELEVHDQEEHAAEQVRGLCLWELVWEEGVCMWSVGGGRCTTRRSTRRSRCGAGVFFLEGGGSVCLWRWACGWKAFLHLVTLFAYAVTLPWFCTTLNMTLVLLSCSCMNMHMLFVVLQEGHPAEAEHLAAEQSAGSSRRASEQHQQQYAAEPAAAY
jgi:hypothetical protein